MKGNYIDNAPALVYGLNIELVISYLLFSNINALCPGNVSFKALVALC